MSDHEKAAEEIRPYADANTWTIAVELAAFLPEGEKRDKLLELGRRADDAAGHAAELDRLRQELQVFEESADFWEKQTADSNARWTQAERERDEARAENERLAGALDDMVDWAERYRGGDKKLHPEEFYIRRDYARKLLKDRAAIAAAQEPTANYVGGAGYPLGPQEPPATDDLPNDLARVLRDQSVIVPQDAAVFDLIAQWAKAPSTTASADPLPAQEPPAEEGEMRRG